jgi:MFS transporter, MHS family, proline/betaine transporter
MDSSQTRRVIAAGMIGNVLEWYDFAIYGYFATAIGRHFFPHEDAVAQLLSAFGVFALGYVMRPVGGALIGHIGDRFGRRAALTFSVAAMAIPTFLIGLLPGYGTLGLAAPIALTLLRMVQGLSVGGEYTSSMVFLVEHAPDGRRGVMGAMASCGATGGILLGSAVGAGFAASMSEATLDAWGWPFRFCSDWSWESPATFCAGTCWRRFRPSGASVPRSSRRCTITGGSSLVLPAYRCSTRSASTSASSTS